MIRYEDENIYTDSELKENATIRKYQIVQMEGSRQITRDVNHYNLQMIIAIGEMHQMVRLLIDIYQ